jgi:hypothetical protein
MEYTVEEVDKFGDALLALPAIDPAQRKLDKQAAIRRIKDKIATAQQRGYTLEQIAESLTGVGLAITTPTLKSYLQRAKKPGGRGARRAARRPASPAPATSAAPEKGPAPTSPSKDGRTDGNPKSTRGEFIATDRERL